MKRAKSDDKKKTKKIEDQQKHYTKIDVLIPANNMEIGILSNQINEVS